MANTATPLAKIPTLFRGQQPKGFIIPVVVVFDTLDSDLAVYTPDAGNFAAIIGMKYAEASAHTLTWKSPAATTHLVEEKPTNTIVDKEIGRPLFIGQKDQAVLLRCGTAVISSMLLYVAEVARIEFLNY